MDPCALHVNGAQLFAGRYRSGPYGEVETPYWSSFGARFVRRISTGKRSGVQESVTASIVSSWSANRKLARNGLVDSHLAFHHPRALPLVGPKELAAHLNLTDMPEALLALCWTERTDAERNQT